MNYLGSGNFFGLYINIYSNLASKLAILHVSKKITASPFAGENRLQSVHDHSCAGAKCPRWPFPVRRHLGDTGH